MASRRLTIRVSERLHSKLAKLARATGRTESEMVREAVQEYVERHGAQESCYEIAREMGLIGCIKDAARDLSTNPKHMARFGGS